MENSLKGLMLAAGTIVTCLIISLGFFIAKEAKNSASTGTGQISKLNNEFIENDKVIYDSAQVSGSEVINIIRKFQNDTVGIKVITNKSSIDYIYSIDASTGSITGSATGSYSTATAVTEDSYINPTARFNGNVIRDSSGIITCIQFSQV